MKDPLFKDVSRDALINLAYEVANVEDTWCEEIFGEGLSSRDIALHNKWKVNNILSSVGLEKNNSSLYNPFLDLYRIGNHGDGSQSKSNVLETKTSAYTNAGSLTWEF